MPMGPIELADTVGLDICLHVAETLKASLDRPMPDIPHWLRRQGRRRRARHKTGKGFYEWKDGKPVKDRDAPQPHRRHDRPADPADARCLRRLPARGRGGGRGDGRRRHDLRHRLRAVPRRPHALCQGARRRRRPRRRWSSLAQRYGERFRPDPGWDRLA